MLYAPVVIPTLNRFEHFKQCLESLERCNNADKTEVYVALDYPPSDKYVEGWRKIDEYLSVKESCHLFKKLTVYRREKNYFFSEEGNAEPVINEISKEYDRYIFSEDDNVFATGFLDFINHGLEKYKDDKSVIAICGYSHYINDSNEINTDGFNSFRNQSYFSWWGAGTWFDRRLGDQDNLEYCRIPFYDKTIMKRVKGIPDSFKYMMLSLRSGVKCPQTDVFQTLRCLIFDYCTITPIASLVNNVGYDDTGVHSYKGGRKCLYSEVKIDNTPFMGIKIAPEDVSNRISKSIVTRYSYKGEVRPWMYLLYYFIKIIGYDRYLKMNHFLRKLLNK